MYFISWKIVNFNANNKISKKIDFKHNERIKEKKIQMIYTRYDCC